METTENVCCRADTNHNSSWLSTEEAGDKSRSQFLTDMANIWITKPMSQQGGIQGLASDLPILEH